MAKYSDIKGFTVQTLSTDTVASQAAGGSWASGGDLNAARESIAGAGSQTAALAFGGNTPGSPKSAANENYNGTSWTELADLNVGRGAIFGYGTTTAAIGSGGLTYPFTPTNFSTAANESWNGSAWTEVNDLNTSRGSGGAASGGTSTAGLVFGGAYVPGPSYAAVANVESWNGTSYTETADLNTARAFIMGGAGVQTAALAYAGTPPTTQKTESWNGSAWTELANLNTTAESRTGSGSLYTAALCFGGASPAPARIGNTEFWDGSSWTEVADLSTARNGMAAAGSDTANLGIAGSLPPNVVTVEEWTAPSTFVKQVEGQLFFNSTTNTFKETITDLGAGSWASGANINTAREGTAGAGDSAEAALLVGGYTTSAPTVRVANTESWNGSSWTEVNDLNQARYVMKSSGTSTAALAYGGDTPPPTNVAITETWDGSSWTEVNDLNTSRRSLGGVGPYTSVVAFGGLTPSGTAVTETWDGTNWTEVGDLNTARGLQASVGVTQTAALSVSGNFPQATQVEEWDGSSWTEIAEVNTARYNASGSGSTTIGLIFGGRIFPGSPPAAYSALTESWNGTAWTERADLATARGDGASAQNISNNSKALYYSGSNPPYVYTEEWTAPLANKTITAS